MNTVAAYDQIALVEPQQTIGKNTQAAVLAGVIYGFAGHMAHEIHVDHRGGGKREWRGLDGAVARLAPPQHGVVSRGQLLRLGLSGRAIERRLERGWLHPLYRGVYALGHPTPSREGRWMAAVLAGEPAAVLSHSSAAALWGIADAGAGRTEVTVPANRRSTHAIEFHRSRLPADEVTVANGIPVTSVPRTIFDLAPGLSTRRVERAINEAEVLHLWDQLSLDDLLHRYPGRRGSATVRGALHGRRSGATTTRSELEERFWPWSTRQAYRGRRSMSKYTASRSTSSGVTPG